MQLFGSPRGDQRSELCVHPKRGGVTVLNPEICVCKYFDLGSEADWNSFGMRNPRDDQHTSIIEPMRKNTRKLSWSGSYNLGMKC